MNILSLSCPEYGALIIACDPQDVTRIILVRCKRCKRKFQYGDFDLRRMKATVRSGWKN